MTDEFQLGETAAAFIQKHHQKFTATTNPDDIPIACYQAYEEYQSLFENKLELFCAERNVGKQQFVDWCTAALQGASESNGGNKEFLEILLAADSFPLFYQLMTTSVKQMELQLLHQQQNKK